MVIGYGNGVKPYLLDKRKDERCPMPSSSDIKVVVCDLLSRATMITSKKSTKRWNEAIAKKDWFALPSGKEWPSPLISKLFYSSIHYTYKIMKNLKHTSFFLNIELIAKNE